MTSPRLDCPLPTLMPRRTRLAVSKDVTPQGDALFSDAGMSDAELVARARSGDATALRDLIDRHYDACWRYAFRMLGDRADADDVAQDTFVRALAGLAAYAERAQFRPWLFTILVNQCRNASVARARRQRRFLSVDTIPIDDARRGVVLPVEPPREDLARAMARLDAAQREALLLRYGEGMEYAEMSQVTGASESALKMRVKRARDRLRDLMKDCER